MARSNKITILRTTRANLNTQTSASGLLAGELYLITDENRIAVGTAVNATQDFAKTTETGMTRSWPSIQSDFIHTNAVQGDYVGSAIATGTLAAAAAGVATNNHPGVVALTSSTSANSGYCFSGISPGMIIGGDLVYSANFKTPAALTNITLRMGLTNSLTATAPTYGAYFSMASTGVIIGNTVVGGAASTTTTLATLAVSTWYHVRMTVNTAATSILFEVYSDTGTLLGSASITTNLPTGAGADVTPMFVGLSAGTTAVITANLDFMSVEWNSARTRGALTGH